MQDGGSWMKIEGIVGTRWGFVILFHIFSILSRFRLAYVRLSSIKVSNFRSREATTLNDVRRKRRLENFKLSASGILSLFSVCTSHRPSDLDSFNTHGATYFQNNSKNNFLSLFFLFRNPFKMKRLLHLIFRYQWNAHTSYIFLASISLARSWKIHDVISSRFSSLSAS